MSNWSWSSGLKCAAGCLIADDEYDPGMENLSWSWLRGDGKVPEAHSNLISDLQGVHDNTRIYGWASDLDKVALKHGIEQ